VTKAAARASVGTSLAVLLCLPGLLAAAGPVARDPVSIEVTGDEIRAPLTPEPGDPARGRSIVVDRQVGMCLLCHRGPFADERFQGSIAPDLSGVGARLSPGQLRLRMVDSRRVSPATPMPPYYSLDGLRRVGDAWAGRTVLTAQQVEDVIAFLRTLGP